MGCGKSKVQAQEEEVVIDHVDPYEFKFKIAPSSFTEHDTKVLILGTGESGKSTLIRQMKRFFCGGFSPVELRDFLKIIRFSVVEDMKMVLNEIDKSGQRISREFDYDIQIINDFIIGEDTLTPSLANSMKRIWDDPFFQLFFQDCGSLGISENFSSFMEKIVQIAEPEYQLTDRDVLSARIRTTGHNCLKFTVENIKTLLVDVGGQMSERKNWYSLHGINVLIYVVSLSDFDQVMFEDANKSRTLDSIDVFKQIISLEAFFKHPLLLVFNKIDLFEKKFISEQQKFLQAYPDYKGDLNSISEALEHVKSVYIKCIPPERSQMPHLWTETICTCAMRDEDAKSFVYALAEHIVDDNSKL